MINLLTRTELFRALTPSEIDMNFMGIERTVNEISNLLSSVNSVEIINDLATGGSTKALSAEQGKILKNSKMNRLQNGAGNVDIAILKTLIGLGFDLSNADLPNVNLGGANLFNVVMTNANLAHANLSSAGLLHANLSYANLYYANLSYAILYRANLSYANLYYTNLSYANLPNADLSNANLSNANLNGASLSYAVLTGAYGLNSDINMALSTINKTPNSSSPWTLTWTDGNIYECNPTTGLFTQL